MPGRYYTKHTFNHFVDNRNRINELNNNYQTFLINNAVEYLKFTDDNLDSKITYLKNLTHDVFRLGRKYKYDCSLNRSQIQSIISSVNDEELKQAYFGDSIQKFTDKNDWFVLAFVLLIIILGIIFFNFFNQI